MREKIRVLFLTSDPFRDRAPLRLDDEVRVIRRALRLRGAGDGVELIPFFARRTSDLQQALLLHEPRIVHFAGDGGAIYMAGPSGRPGVVESEVLATLFDILSEWVKVVIVNGCDTVPIVEALGEVVDYAIGMSQPLTDPSAIVFAGAFHGALGMGETVRDSFERAVNQLRNEGVEEAALPVLRIHPGVDTSVPLVSKRVLPFPADDAPPTRLPIGQVIDLAKFRDNRAPSENRPGAEVTSTQRITIDEATGDYAFQTG
ncbi:MAG TPA: hypothetical protein VE913_16160 [Longimicrobium sp.]|nr:hypothetical protein [Longimicrobium sp.]